jgi:glucose dehydrogenase
MPVHHEINSNDYKARLDRMSSADLKAHVAEMKELSEQGDREGRERMAIISSWRSGKNYQADKRAADPIAAVAANSMPLTSTEVEIYARTLGIMSAEHLDVEREEESILAAKGFKDSGSRLEAIRSFRAAATALPPSQAGRIVLQADPSELREERERLQRAEAARQARQAEADAVACRDRERVAAAAKVNDDLDKFEAQAREFAVRTKRLGW